MATELTIRPADLSYINSALSAINRSLNNVENGVDAANSRISTVNDNVKTVYSDLMTLMNEFRSFVLYQVRAGRKQIAHTEVVRIRQELEHRYGHYDIVRRTTLGILQADDIGIVKKETISTATEEMMIQTPGYWLAPCLVALAAWISDHRELSEKALREAISRDDEKTSLFFALMCRRSDRRQASLKWTQRYLENLDEEDLDRKAVIILDAFASGLLGTDSEGMISKTIDEWMDRLSSKPGYVEAQIDQWSRAITARRRPIKGEWQYLERFSPTWDELRDVMEGAQLHRRILKYFKDIFDQPISSESLKVQLDAILDDLVTSFDAEELPLRMEEKKNQLIIDFDGDVDRADRQMEEERSAFEMHKDFTQLLTDAAMNPESADASVSTQKFAIALSKEWISEAYKDIAAKNRMKVPHTITITVDSFTGTTTDGCNETELLTAFNELVDKEREAELAKAVMTDFEKNSHYIGGGVAGAGALLALTGHGGIGTIAAIAGICLVASHFSKQKQIERAIENIEAHFAQKREEGAQAIRATLAEVVDFRDEFAREDAHAQEVIDMIGGIEPDQQIHRLQGSNRRINVKTKKVDR